MEIKAEIKEFFSVPVKITVQDKTEKPDEILNEKEKTVSFSTENTAVFKEKGAFMLLDFGKEMSGGVRIITAAVKGAGARFRLTFGESAGEACSSPGEKNSGNDHSPRDTEVLIPSMSDLTFGQTGFRFLKIELVSSSCVYIQNVFAVNRLPLFPSEAEFHVSDKELEQIINTAAYTLKLNFQNGYIWDGIKRDRLIWSGDLNPEIITSMYIFGDTENIKNSLDFLKKDTPAGRWINNIPSYSAWWVVNMCQYSSFFGKKNYFSENAAYAENILKRLNSSVDKNGNMDFGIEGGMCYFLDWPTCGTPDAKTGTACLIILAAKIFSEIKENKDARELIIKLEKYINVPSSSKQTRAFQILAGRNDSSGFLEEGGAEGLSTFMAYYILKADFLSGGKKYIDMIKEYFGTMLRLGATSFFEDFNIKWAENAQPLYELPSADKKDIHGDYGDFCYKGYRHSLCHGWASGVLAFIIEYIFGIEISEGGRKLTVKPHIENTDFEITLPWADDKINIIYKNSVLSVKAPEGVTVTQLDKK